MSIIIFLGIIMSLCSGFMLIAKSYGKAFPIINWISFIILILFLIYGISLRVHYNIEQIKYVYLKNSIEEMKKPKVEKNLIIGTNIKEKDIIDMNYTLAKAKYLNTTCLNIFISDSFVNREFLK